jgi:hypothetical protein
MIKLSLPIGFTILCSFIIIYSSNTQERRKSSQELQQLATQYTLEFASKKAEAERIARQKGWVIREEYPDGHTIEIMEIGPNGMPESLSLPFQPLV